ncbi:MAG: beta-ketoacyl-[acyl-carrier-protein] synthase family protein [Bacteroidales bacterium]|jgi:3-oxoacyl-[acyl-carrier-protein] synthase-1|nr:beta-ketoacyl-[acyl-carrier-protein] synthase family protein [Bacteroidales bacterium]
MRIAITGIGVISGQGVGVKQTLRNLLNPQLFLGKAKLFDTSLKVPVCEVPLSNKELAVMVGGNHSRTAMLGMVAAREAMTDAFGGTGAFKNGGASDFNGVGASDFGGGRIGLVSSTSTAGMDRTEKFYRLYMQHSIDIDIRDIEEHDCGSSTINIARYCKITDFATTISTACSSSANAIILGAGLIRQGLLDTVLVGGTDALCISTLNGFNSLKILDSEPARPFDASRAGLNLGEGAGYIVLQREDIVTRTPYAYLSGYANATDTFHQTASSENGEGSFRAMSEALMVSGLQQSDIDYINVHGTGTPNNDTSEGAAILRIFGTNVNTGRCVNIPPFSSTKPLTGHTLAACGGIEAVFCVLALQYGLLYPNLNFKNPILPELVPQTKLVTDRPLSHILSNSLGFGGNCTSLIFSHIR